jgi:hypothetical protein
MGEEEDGINKQEAGETEAEEAEREREVDLESIE